MTINDPLWDSLALDTGGYDPSKLYHVKYDKQGHTVNIGLAGSSFNIKKELAAAVEQVKQQFPELKSNADVLGNALVHWINRPDIKQALDGKTQRALDLFTQKMAMMADEAEYGDAEDTIELLERTELRVSSHGGEGVESLFNHAQQISTLVSWSPTLKIRVDQLMMRITVRYSTLLGVG